MWKCGVRSTYIRGSRSLIDYGRLITANRTTPTPYGRGNASLASMSATPYVDLHTVLVREGTQGRALLDQPFTYMLYVALHTLLVHRCGKLDKRHDPRRMYATGGTILYVLYFRTIIVGVRRVRGI